MSVWSRRWQCALIRSVYTVYEGWIRTTFLACTAYVHDVYAYDGRSALYLIAWVVPMLRSGGAASPSYICFWFLSVAAFRLLLILECEFFCGSPRPPVTATTSDGLLLGTILHSAAGRTSILAVHTHLTTATFCPPLSTTAFSTRVVRYTVKVYCGILSVSIV